VDGGDLKAVLMDSHGRGALQTPNAPWRGGESRSRYENPLTERSCRFDPGSGHQLILGLQRQPRRSRHTPDIDWTTTAAQFKLRQL
jgi:hypothetical protein